MLLTIVESSTSNIISRKKDATMLLEIVQLTFEAIKLFDNNILQLTTQVTKLVGISHSNNYNVLVSKTHEEDIVFIKVQKDALTSQLPSSYSLTSPLEQRGCFFCDSSYFKKKIVNLGFHSCLTNVLVGGSGGAPFIKT